MIGYPVVTRIKKVKSLKSVEVSLMTYFYHLSAYVEV